MKCAALVLLAGCATTRAVSPSTPHELAAQAASCDDFALFDAQLRAASETVLSTQTGATLLEDEALLSSARRNCARHVLEGLPALREASGLDAVQRALDTLARAFSQRDLRTLVKDVTGAAELEAMVLEAFSHGAGSAKLPTQPLPPDVGDLTCRDEPAACARARCLANAGEVKRLEASARECLDAQRSAPAEDAAREVASLLDLLRTVPAGGALTEAMVHLEGLRRQQWPLVLAASAQRPALAARIAAPFASLESARAEVARVRDAAVRAHLELARAAGTNEGTAQLHRLVAASLGGPVAEHLSPSTGAWLPSSWRCASEAPALPAPIPGAQLRLEASCRKVQQRKNPHEPRGELATFDLEQQLTPQVIEGQVRATCGGRVFTFPIALKVEVFDGSAARNDALTGELEQRVAQARQACATAVRVLEQTECGQGTDGPTREQRFVDYYRARGEWAECFSRGFTARYGVPPQP